MDLPDQVAQAALRHYSHILPPNKGKPKENEWTVFAAIVATTMATTKDAGEAAAACGGCWVVCCATGTKCCVVPVQNRSNVSGLCILHDSHAEVLARRGLMVVLWKEIENAAKNTATSPISDTSPADQGQHHQSLLERIPTETGPFPALSNPFQFRKDIRLHMYISDSPCGDASIYDLKGGSSPSDLSPNAKTTAAAQFTGAKVIASSQTNVTVAECCGDVVHRHSHNGRTGPLLFVREEADQLVGRLRTKSGRSNLDAQNRSTSMSCSDKLVRWSVLGLQGTMMRRFLPSPIRLSSIVVGSDPRAIESDHITCANPSSRLFTTQLLALQRAISNRIETVQSILLKVDQCVEAIANSYSQQDIQVFASNMLVPEVSITDHLFARGKTVVEAVDGRQQQQRAAVADDEPPKKKQKIRKTPPAGISLNWHQSLGDNDVDGCVEVTVGARGLRQGKLPKVVPNDFVQLQSRLCRMRMLEWEECCCRAMSVSDTVAQKNRHENNDNGTNAVNSEMEYHNYKREHRSVLEREIRARIFSQGPLAGWLIGDGIQQTVEEFGVAAP
jgi:Adenosine-deaminase (editase) domain